MGWTKGLFVAPRPPSLRAAGHGRESGQGCVVGWPNESQQTVNRRRSPRQAAGVEGWRWVIVARMHVVRELSVVVCVRRERSGAWGAEGRCALACMPPPPLDTIAEM